ncbi:hypothetical protein CMV_026156, partial [Castanea mollissima]
TPDLSAMHHDTSSDLKVVDTKLKNILEISNTSLEMRKVVVQLDIKPRSGPPGGNWERHTNPEETGSCGGNQEKNNTPKETENENRQLLCTYMQEHQLKGSMFSPIWWQKIMQLSCLMQMRIYFKCCSCCWTKMHGTQHSCFCWRLKVMGMSEDVSINKFFDEAMMVELAQQSADLHHAIM